MLQLHKLVNNFIVPLNVRYSGSIFKQSSVHSLIRKKLDRKSKLTTNEWHELRENVLQLLPKKSAVNVDGTILENCLPNQLNTGKSYIDYLKETGEELRVDTLANYLKLYYNASQHGTEITAKDHLEITDMCQHLVGKCSVLGAKLGSAIIQGLVLTADWRKSLDVLHSIRIYSTPQMIAYSAVVQRAIQEEDDYVVWNLLNFMATDCDVLDNDVFIAYIRQCEKNRTSLTENINKMLTFIGDNQIVVSRKVASEFQRVFNRLKHRCHITTVSNEGKCHSCRKGLRSINITDNKFNSLTSHFSDKALLLSRSSPQELDCFKTFIDRTMPYDFVIDGLNTSLLPENPQQHSPNAKPDVSLLASVVKHFADRKKTVLVIGRKNMERWPQAQMNYIRRNSHLFLTENLRSIFLYSALKSGPNTHFVTRDLLRDHAIKLVDDKLKSVFHRWQQQHQYMVKSIGESGLVTFENRSDSDMNAQQADEGCCWHIPFEDSSHCTFQYCEFRKNWLCVTKN